MLHNGLLNGHKIDIFIIIYQLTGILGVRHGKSLVSDLSILFIVVCVDNHLEGINSRRYSCYRHCWEGVATEPRGTYKYFIYWLMSGMLMIILCKLITWEKYPVVCT